MANEFEMLLARQAQNPNFLSGAITAGAAKLMSERTAASSRSIDKLNQSLKLISDEPLTRAEQVEQLQGDTDVQEKVKNIEEQAVEYQALSQNIIDRKAKFSQVYDQALTELALVGGEEAQRLAGVLQARKEGKLKELDELGNVPKAVLEYEALRTQLEWSKDKYAEWYEDEQMQKDIALGADTIMQDIEFGEIQGGDVKTWDNKKLKEFTERQNRIIDRTYDKLGGQVSKGSIGAAFKVAMDNAGKSFSFQELNPVAAAQLAKLRKDNQADIDGYKGILTAWSGLYNGLDQNTRDVLSEYMKTGTMPDNALRADGKVLDEKYIKGLSDIFKPDGKYGYYYSRLTGATGKDWNKRKNITLKSGNNIEIPEDQSLVGIIRPRGFAGFMDQNMLYNPKTAQMYLDEQDKEFAGLLDIDIGKNAEDEFIQDFVPKFSGAFYLPEDYTQFSVFGGRK